MSRREARRARKMGPNVRKRWDAVEHLHTAECEPQLRRIRELMDVILSF
jgi:hypothetical protein